MGQCFVYFKALAKDWSLRGVAGQQPRIGGRRVFAPQIAPQGAWPPLIKNAAVVRFYDKWGA